MKPQFLIAILFLCAIEALHAQVDQETVKAYSTWVIPLERGPALKGFLYEVKDSSVVISYSAKKSDYVTGIFNSDEIWSQDIKAIHLRKKGAQGTAILVGGIAGALVGLLVGIAAKSPEGPDQLEEDYNTGAMIVFPLLFTGVGVGIGAMIGGIKKQFPVRGSQAQFRMSRMEMEDRSIKHSLNETYFAQATFSKLQDSVTDADGNVYHLLALGGQVWMAENLRSAHFADGSEIAGVKENAAGKENLYDFQMVIDRRKLCPSGYHVPSQGEWNSLFSSLGGEQYAGRKLEMGFSPKGSSSQWWSSTEYDPEKAQRFYVDNDSHGALITSAPKTLFLPIRCIRDH